MSILDDLTVPKYCDSIDAKGIYSVSDNIRMDVLYSIYFPVKRLIRDNISSEILDQIEGEIEGAIR